MLVIACAIAAAATPAQGSTAFRTDPGGNLLTGSTTLTNTTSGTSTVTFPGATLLCGQTSLDVDLNSNVSSGSSYVTGTITSYTFTSCTDTIVVINFSSCVLAPGTFPSIRALVIKDTGGSFYADDATVRCSIAGSTTSFCYYTLDFYIGLYTNATSEILGSADWTATTGPGSLGAACPSPGLETESLRHLVQGGTNRTITLTTS